MLGCPIPEPLKPFKGWDLCMGLPEDVNPRSLRCGLGHWGVDWVIVVWMEECWDLCMGLPEDVHPGSQQKVWSADYYLTSPPRPPYYRSIIGHNTNIWAAKASKLGVLNLRGHVGMMKPHSFIKEYFGEERGRLSRPLTREVGGRM